jgi:hypothetical protein
MKTKYKGSASLKAIILMVFTCCITCCSNNSIVVSEHDYPTEVIGSWSGTAGNLKEAISLNHDSTFVCQVYPNGFIANTLSQGVKGSVNGKWKIRGAIITLIITGEKNENLENKIATSTILSLNKNELVLKSDNGETSRFERVKF